MPADLPPSTVLAVHPTQLYEVTLMTIAFMVLWRWRLRDKPLGWLFGAYLVFAGIERFLIEILRAKDDRFVAGFTIAQVTSVLIVAIGVVVMSKLATAPNPAPGDYLTNQKA